MTDTKWIQCFNWHSDPSELKIYSQPVLRGHLWEKVALYHRWPLKRRVNSYEIFYDKTRKRWPFNTGDCNDRLDCMYPWYELIFLITWKCNISTGLQDFIIAYWIVISIQYNNKIYKSKLKWLGTMNFWLIQRKKLLIKQCNICFYIYEENIFLSQQISNVDNKICVICFTWNPFSPSLAEKNTINSNNITEQC